MGKLPITVAIFKSYVKLPQGIWMQMMQNLIQVILDLLPSLKTKRLLRNLRIKVTWGDVANGFNKTHDVLHARSEKVFALAGAFCGFFWVGLHRRGAVREKSVSVFNGGACMGAE